MRIGFFGGSFDPPHLGHLVVARRAADVFSLGRVLLAPTASQPLKPAGPEAPFADRLALVQLLCTPDSRLCGSTFDEPRLDGQPNYTIDTLAKLRGELAAGDEIFSIVGADAFRDFTRWRAPKALLAASEWIVVSRPGYRLQTPGFPAREAARVHRLDDVHELASATRIRERLREGDDCRDWLPPELLQYIRERHLYGT